MKNLAFRTLAATAILALSACNLPAVNRAESGVDASVGRIEPAISQVRQPETATVFGQVKMSEAVWVGGSSAKLRTGERLPRKFDRDGVTMVSARPIQITEVGAMIYRSTGIPVIFAPEILGLASSSSTPAPMTASPSTPSSAGMQPPAPQNPAFDMNAAIAAVGHTNSGTSAGAAMPSVRVNYVGPLTGFLDVVGSNYGVAWEYRNGAIRIYRLVTRTFSIAAMPTSVELASSMKAGSDASGGSSDSGSIQAGSQQQAEVKMSLDLWKEIDKTISGMVGGQGFYAVSQATSSVTVSAPFDVMSRVADYIDLQNEKFMRQVSISVEVLNVSITDSDSFNLNLQGVFNNGKFGATVGALSGAAGQASALVGSGIPGVNIGLLDPASSYAGSSALMEALSKMGKVSVVTTASVTTMSGVPVPLQVSNTRNYVRSISSTLTNVGQQSSIETDKVNTGFSLNVLPKVLPDGQVMLQYGINISELVGADNGFDTFTSADNKVQLPNINQRSFIQQNMMRTGSTLVLAGFEQVRSQMSKSGVGSADFPLLGGGQSGQGQRDMLVIMITPVVIERSAQSASAELASGN